MIDTNCKLFQPLIDKKSQLYLGYLDYSMLDFSLQKEYDDHHSQSFYFFFKLIFECEQKNGSIQDDIPKQNSRLKLLFINGSDIDGLKLLNLLFLTRILQYLLYFVDMIYWLEYGVIVEDFIDFLSILV